MLSWHSPNTGLDTHLRLVSFLVGVVYLIRLPQLYQCRISFNSYVLNVAL